MNLKLRKCQGKEPETQNVMTGAYGSISRVSNAAIETVRKSCHSVGPTKKRCFTFRALFLLIVDFQ